MCLKPNNVERSHLGFADTVQSAFSFLTRVHGFKCVEAGPTFVRYESDRIFVNVYHGRVSYELGVQIGRLGFPGESEQGYTLSELMRLVDPESEAGFRYFTALTASLVNKGVAQLTKLLQKYAMPALGGDERIFDQLHAQREQWKTNLANDVERQHVRPQAEAAFRRKDYPEAFRLYESIREGLSPSELKRLEYARNNSGER